MIYPFLLNRSDSTMKIKRNIYFLVEGKNTEQYYFDSLINESSFDPYDNINFFSFTKLGNDEGLTQPRKMLEKANEYANDKKNKFNKNIDVIYVIFDLDVFNNDQSEINKLLKYKKKYIRLGFSNPAFELFLLLHLDDAYNKYIKKNKKNILLNNYVNGKRFVNNLVYEITGVNTKKSEKVGLFALNFKNAIKEEKKINEKFSYSGSKVTSNIGKIIESLMEK